ncbi:hypothetical protein [Fibrella aquatilis]|uniref:Uncharacterized protein n=1 Tax=Fibrella aquatilis TaxID=2817059 RepID=A0A939JWV8_9BACT|nr:hypothetical protein [Fibrella aquatilis]MBO0932317.1 hypothetical protein [Fibrella aquatilis]
MKNDPDFYIGWQDTAPPASARVVRWVVVGLCMLVPLLAGVLVGQQRGFSTAVFEYGQPTTLTGQLIRYPVPFLRISVKNSPASAPRFERVLLIGYGKHGADSTLDSLERKYGSLSGKQLTIRGTSIHYDNHAALELTDGVGALLRVLTPKNLPAAPPVQLLGPVTAQGEIVDPKCFLGVMKPGDGRPHRSCAVRCIAGGIPPLFWVRNPIGRETAYLLTGPSGEPINGQVLNNVGQLIRLTGQVEQADNWLIMKLETGQLAIIRLDVRSQIALCR